MSEIRNLTRNGETFYPLTHEKAVIGMDEFKETITEQVENYRPIEITGDVVNAPDEEDITSDSNNLLKFKNRNNLYGLGKVILRRGSSFASQVTQANTIYVIQYNFDLDSARINIPNGAILLFEGGSLSNGTLVCADLYDVRLVYYQDLSVILSSVTLEGNFIYKACDKDTIGSVSVDNSSIEENQLGQLTVKDNGIQNTHLNGSVVDNLGLVLDSNNKISIKADGTVSQIIGNMKGVANGIASLDSTGKVPSSQLPDNVALLGDYEGQAVIPGFDPETDTVHTKAQVLTTAKKDAAVSNILDKGPSNGMGKVVLKATDDFKTVVESATGGNTIFVIKYDFTLTGDVTIPANCILEFDGGSISGNHEIRLNSCKIIAGKYEYIFRGNIDVHDSQHLECYICWFGILPSNSASTNSANFPKAFTGENRTIIVPNGRYNFDSSAINITRMAYSKIVGENYHSHGNSTVEFALHCDSSLNTSILNFNIYCSTIEGICFTNAGNNKAQTCIELLDSINLGQIDSCIKNCDFNGFDVGIKAHGRGIFVENNAFRSTNTGIIYVPANTQANPEEYTQNPPYDGRAIKITDNRGHNIGYLFSAVYNQAQPLAGIYGMILSDNLVDSGSLLRSDIVIHDSVISNNTAIGVGT